MSNAAPPDRGSRRKPFVRWLMQKRWRMTRALTLGAQVCVIDQQAGVLLVRHGYRPGWHFPGGGVEVGENVIDAAVREIDEEVGIVPRVPPVLHGIFNNRDAFPGDHVVIFVLRDFVQVRVPAPTFEISEHGFFALDALPAATTAGTRRRLGEIFRGQPIVAEW